MAVRSSDPETSRLEERGRKEAEREREREKEGREQDW